MLTRSLGAGSAQLDLSHHLCALHIRASLSVLSLGPHPVKVWMSGHPAQLVPVIGTQLPPLTLSPACNGQACL